MTTVGLNEDNNESYRYLRSVGNQWQFNVEDLHPKMLSRLYKRFDTFDLDSDGKMEMDEILYWPDRMRQLVNATEDQVEKMRQAVRVFFFNKGVDPVDGLLRHNWVEANRVFAEAERERERRGEPSLIALLSNAYYDVLDDDGDGTVDIDELKTMMNKFQDGSIFTLTKVALADAKAKFLGAPLKICIDLRKTKCTAMLPGLVEMPPAPAPSE